jgi:anti-anti-sigma regulatory factor
MLKIQRLANEEIVFTLCGRMDAEQATALNQLFLDEPRNIQIVVDLKDLTLVDRDAVRFLERCEADGIEFRNSPAYIRVWIDRERRLRKITG